MSPIAGGRVWSPDNFRPSIYFTLVYWKNAVLTTLLSIFTFIINWLWLNFIYNWCINIERDLRSIRKQFVCFIKYHQPSECQSIHYPRGIISPTQEYCMRQLLDELLQANFWIRWSSWTVCLSNFLFSQKASKKKNPIVHSILKLLLPNLFGKDREDILVDVQCLLTLSNPQDLLVRIRQLIKCPFIKSSILPSRLELEKANSRLNDDFRSILWTVENLKWISCHSGQVRQVRCWKYL